MYRVTLRDNCVTRLVRSLLTLVRSLLTNIRASLTVLFYFTRRTCRMLYLFFGRCPCTMCASCNFRCQIMSPHSLHTNKNNKIPLPILSPTTPDRVRTRASELARERVWDWGGGEREHMHTRTACLHTPLSNGLPGFKF